MAEEIEFWDFEDENEMVEAVVGDIKFIIESALDARGQALVAFPGGSTPMPIFEALAATKLRWKNVTIIPTDERLVPMDSDLSNVAKIAKIFMPLGARVLPLNSEAEDYKLAGGAANARLSDLQWPPDLVWLGMGGDGHTASIFEGPDLEEALEAADDMLAVGVEPDPMPEDAPVHRVTLTASAIKQARTTMLVFKGADKRAVLDQAISEGEMSMYPIGRVIDRITVPIDIYCM